MWPLLKMPTSRSMLLGTAMVTICHNESTFTVRALIDSGSEATFISNSLQKRLHLASKKVSARVSGLNNTISGRVQLVCSITIGSPRNKSLRVEAEEFVPPKLTGLLLSRSINSSIIKGLSNIPLADNNFYTSQKVDLLIGADLYPKIIVNGVKSKMFGSLVAQRIVFGWVLTGSVPSEETKINSTITQQRTQNHFCSVKITNFIPKQQQQRKHHHQQQHNSNQRNRNALAEPEITDRPLSLVNQWKKLKALSQHFCQRWKTKYLKELQKRKKWKHSQQNVQVDDLVVVRDENLPPNEWRVGSINKVYPGLDQRVRVVDIQTQRGLICRPQKDCHCTQSMLISYYKFTR
ncbi:uncharacterized protein LOC126766637 [Bactrocera neohumeralis]|uniref:uncharacterized protein LOC126766637 n=1 Tax=Bactrocera neohumeralis TaxID=98809 RepID=UPI0021651562|nr:uncharacterized protein LOC126766637 [Bactrocera neohumeralis]